jgi:SPP1 gp7 family putative phage head morphogenesis protein
METKFTQFLRAGGNGEFLIRRRADAWVGVRTAFSIKSEFPNYAALRDNFAARLDAVIQSNTSMLLQSIGAQYDPPLTASELPVVSTARAYAIGLWDERIAVIWTEWHSHLQRLRPIREAMEQDLLRGFAALINELRQRDLGIRQYIWRSRDDGKVRSSHAAHDDQVFSWDDPPEGGHPGQAFNCRCHAEPYVGQAIGDADAVIVPAQLTITDGLPVGGGLPDIGAGMRVLSRGGAAALALYGVEAFHSWAEQDAVRRGAEILGLDLTTVEGVLAARAYVWGTYNAGFISSADWSGPTAEVAAQAIALYEMANPGALGRAEGGSAADLAAIEAAVEAALQAYAAGRLTTSDGELAKGWAEVFPELTDDERKLGQLPGFTPERLDQFREEYPAEVLGLPIHTGHGPVEDPSSNTTATPIPDVGRPSIVTTINPHSVETVRIPDDRAIHILDGDSTGGGHRSGTGSANKTEFPPNWTDAKILDAVREVAGTGTVEKPARRPGELEIIGEVDGVKIKAIVKANGDIRTAYPISGPGVVRNPGE